MLCTGPAQDKHPINDGYFHHAWGESPTADTLGAGVSPSHSAPGVWLPGCSPSWSGSASRPEAAGELDSSGGRGASGHYVPSQEWESGNVPGQGTGLWGKHAGNIRSPFPTAWSLTSLCWALWGGRHVAEAARPAQGPWHICAHPCRVYSVTRSQIAPQPCPHAQTHRRAQICIQTSTRT